MKNPLHNISFALLAVKVLSNDSSCRRKLSGNTVYPLVKWVDWIDDYYVKIREVGMKQTLVYDRFMSEVNDDRVQVQAIVGENGSGKSSLVEFMIRLVNNFAAATLGETVSTPQSEPLHYINGIEGALLYVADGSLYQLLVKRRKIALYRYTFIEENDRFELDIKNPLFNSTNGWAELVPLRRMENQKDLAVLMEKFFFSVVINYSLYAYNQNDYADEQCSLNYERKIRGTNRKYDLNERHWLTGVFHKNDGYETPLTITPYRDSGNIDVNLEKELSIERLVSVMLIGAESSIMGNSTKHENFKGFRVLNGHLKVTSICLKNNEKQYDNKYLNKLKIFERLYFAGFDAMRSVVIESWSDVVGVRLESCSQKMYYEQAINYLTYKTLRTSAQYSIYSKFINAHRGMTKRFDENLLRKFVKDELAKDRSHITRKIRQVLVYLICDIYDFKGKHITDKGYVLDIDEIAKKATKALESISKHNQFLGDIGDFAPPPFMKMDINLVNENTGNKVLFEALSSGEKQQAFSVSGILYHLLNVGSANRTEGSDRVKYRYVNIILEEMELYYHPEMQKNLLMFLLDGIKQTNIMYVEGINILIVTHSPFILSDVVRDNILLLKKQEGVFEDLNLKTFGANIYEMLDTGFFMSKGAIGDFAQWHINKIIDKLNDKTSRADELLDMIEIIDDSIIRESLLLKFEEVFKNNEAIDLEIEMLQSRIKELKERRNNNVVSARTE